MIYYAANQQKSIIVDDKSEILNVKYDVYKNYYDGELNSRIELINLIEILSLLKSENERKKIRYRIVYDRFQQIEWMMQVYKVDDIIWECIRKVKFFAKNFKYFDIEDEDEIIEHDLKTLMNIIECAIKHKVNKVK